MKRIVSFLLALLCALPLASCSGQADMPATEPADTSVSADADSSTLETTVADTTAEPKNEFRKIKVESAEIAALLEKMSTYYLRDFATAPGDYPDYNDWKSSTFQLGMLEAFKSTGDMNYYRFVAEIAERYGYLVNFGNDTSYLDLATTMVVYSDLDKLAQNDAKLTDTIRNAEYALRSGTLNYSWIDEIYMVSYAYQYLTARTGDKRYGELDYQNYMKWRAKLFDKEEGLWYRDSKYIYDPNTKYVSDSSTPNVSPNGKKVFWSRGNAWVYVSLIRDLSIMDENALGYKQYLLDFKAMSEALLNAVQEDGYWCANLGDPQHIDSIEMTGTGGFWYGICAGIELGILDAETYLPVAEKVYRTLTEEVLGKTGRVGYCQPVGAAPAKATKNDTNMFGVGLVMMGAAAFMRLSEDYTAPVINIDDIKAADAELMASSDRAYYLEPGFIKKSNIAKAYSAAKKDYSSNTPDNLFDGDYMYQVKGSSWVGGGLRNGNVTLEITLKQPIDFYAMSFMTRSCRAYKFRIEASKDGKEYVTALDMTNKSYPSGRLYNWTFDTVENVKYIRVVFTGAYRETLDWVTLTEMFIYAADN